MNTIALLEKLVSIPSVFPREERISIFLTSYLKKIGFEIEIVTTGKNRNNIIATYGKSKKYLGFYGHMDTVSREEKGTNPYKVVISGDKAFGLGTEDMKGGIAAILQTGQYAVKNNLPIKIIFGVDEEGISQGAHDLVNSGLLKDINFLISAESGQVINAKQSFNVCYGRKGRILFSLEVFGKKAHAAESNKGINAIDKASELVHKLLRMRFAPHPKLGRTRVVIHTINGATDSFSVPESCCITFSLLTTPNITSNYFIEQVQQLAEKIDVSMVIRPVERKTPYGESYEVKNYFFLRVLEKKIFTPHKVKPIYATSVADENIFANRLHIPVISLGPIGGGGHTKNEWISISSLQEVEKAYKEILVLYNNN